ncbi:MAG: peptidase S41 [Prevotellaceae bacterium]|jgi:carboxyl-terminal processing protease|nr:peptidase S41 [Prevotellaceae bacterium]
MYTIAKKIVAAVGLLCVAGFAGAQSSSFRFAKSIDVFFAVLQELDMYYVDSIDYDHTIMGAIDDMLATLDPYTIFISEEEVNDFDISTTGQYGGIGALIRKRGDYAEFVEIYQGFPADRHGVKVGDRLLAVDSVLITSNNVTDVSALLKGKMDTKVVMKVLKLQTQDTLSLSVARAQIQLPSVPYYGLLEGKVGYIYFATFTKNCSEDVKHAINELKSKGATSLILDLRSNAGGLMDEAVEVANLFLPKGQEVLSVRGRAGDEVKYKTKRSAVDADIPLVVMANSMSASSSEIVAGALQDLDRAVVVGQRSYGKGLVQSVRPLPFNEKLKLTTAKYYIPSGRCVQIMDYTHRNPDGSVGKVPDSLVRKFTTRAGRTVYDGGGITPDEVIAPQPTPQVLQRLYEKFLFFDFANRFFIDNDTLTTPSRFKLQDTVYRQFIAFIEKSGFTYETASQQALRSLVEATQREQCYDSIQPDLRALSEKLTPDLARDLVRFKDDILAVLGEEIVSRYYYQTGRIEFSVAGDKEVGRARDILLDATLYKSFLQKK